MKIETSFSEPVPPLALRTVFTACAVALLLGAGTVAIRIDAGVLESEVAETNARLAQLEERRAEIGAHPALPSAAELAVLQARVDTVNSLSVTDGRSLVALLSVLEELLPREAWLVSLVHKARDGELVLVAEARQAELLTRFLFNLEKSSRFSEVLLLRQTPLGRKEQRTVQFEVRLKEHA